MSLLAPQEEAQLVSLFPFVQSKPPGEQPRLALQALMDTERWRRGEPEPSGAYHVTFLTQGRMLKEEFDLSVHAHTGWPLSALTCDVREMIRVNQRYGFPAGDAFLKAVVDALRAALPTGRTVRIHSDAFAVLLPPSADTPLSLDLRDQTLDALTRTARAFTAAQGGAALEMGFTLGLLALTVHDPSHWQVLGPLAWAELERAHVLARSGQAQGIQERSLDLRGAVPRP